MDKKLQVGVKALFKSKKDNTYLLLHRNLKKYNETKENPWDIVGGRIEVGNTLVENLQREIYEETKFKLLQDFESLILGAQDILLEDKHIVRITYLISIDEELIPILSDEHDKFKWVDFNELKNSCDKYLKELLN